ncbi:toll/interleukin-1 receptor domain-containing protein [Dactylosporangium sp. NPDC049525]|uniref:toll/interleukin-1 receptor domain-containing protein n=1 Tax=Dactylosporangium sp. NPDC049525 TaxID=3154730 RepID=UPI00342AF607
MTEFVVGESVLVDEPISGYEALSVFFKVADERGHLAPSVVVDDTGRPVTHRDYTDRMGVAHAGAGLWAFCREPLAEAVGLPEGTHWVRDHASHLMFNGGSPFASKPHFSAQLYIQQFGSSAPQMMSPVCTAGTVSFAPDGSRICFLEERLGHLTDHNGMAKYLLWEYELALGTRRMIAGFPAPARLDFTEVAYGPDGRYIHLCDWASGTNLLVRASDGMVIQLDIRSAAVSWNPSAGVNAMIVMRPEPGTGRVNVYDYDLATEALSLRCDLRSTTGLPLRVRELSMSSAGVALVTASVGPAGVEQLRRGGVHAAAIVDIDRGTIEPALPVGFRTPGAQRRHTSPRWCDAPPPMTASRTEPAERLMAAASISSCEPDGPALAQDLVGRWLEILDGIEQAWRARRMPLSRLAQEFAQFAIGCRDLAPQAAADVLKRLDELALHHPVPRAVRSRIASPYQVWSPIGSETVAVSAAPEASVEIRGAVGRLIAATTVAAVLPAVRQFLAALQSAGRRPDQAWEWLAELSTGALFAADYTFAATAALGTIRWNLHHVDLDHSVTSYGLGLTPSRFAATLVLNGFEACTHLPERTELGRSTEKLFDVETTRDMCQGLLQRLPLPQLLASSARPRRPRGEPTEVSRPVPGARWNARESTLAQRRVFISYMREDATIVDRVVARLRAAGVDVWLDRSDVRPAADWRREIHQAIQDGVYFVACFSPRYSHTDRSYMNMELRQAVYEMQLMPFDRRWFVPVVLEPCKLPDIVFDATTRLDHLQCIDLSADWDTGVRQLIEVLTSSD